MNDMLLYCCYLYTNTNCAIKTQTLLVIIKHLPENAGNIVFLHSQTTVWRIQPSHNAPHSTPTTTTGPTADCLLTLTEVWPTWPETATRSGPEPPAAVAAGDDEDVGTGRRLRCRLQGNQRDCDNLIISAATDTWLHPQPGATNTVRCPQQAWMTEIHVTWCNMLGGDI